MKKISRRNFLRVSGAMAAAGALAACGGSGASTPAASGAASTSTAASAAAAGEDKFASLGDFTMTVGHAQPEGNPRFVSMEQFAADVAEATNGHKAYYLQVYSYTISLAKNREIAEEITQNTFYKAVSTTSQFKGKSDELTWLCSIAKNLYHDEMRSRQRVADVSEINDLPSNENVENSVADSDMAFRIHLVLHRLEEPYKEVFQLRVFGELSFSQIAAIFGKTESWARVTYHRAKLKIQERMDEKHE